jgi:DNA-directed RNA polymerase subunit alpha
MEKSMEEIVYSNWRKLIRPKRLERSAKSNETYGKFVVKPLERGFGVTIGNALRRVLLSSLQGPAITSVKIEGVLHEFSSVPGMIEDVTDVVLNLKSVRLRTTSNEEVTGSLDVSGVAGKVTTVVRAGDLTFDANCEVLNPNQEIATLTEEGRLQAQVKVRMDKGYISAKGVELEDATEVAVDAIHTPVQRVKYLVTNARVGQNTDFDKLELEVWTDGSIYPEDALAYAAKILKEQVQLFINFAEDEEPPEIEEVPEEEEVNENLKRRVDELELSVRSQNCLQNAGIEYIYQLVEKSEAEMLKTKNFGRKSLNEIKELLADIELSLGMKLSNFPKNTLG